MNYANTPLYNEKKISAIKVYLISSSIRIHENPIPLPIMKRENHDELANY